jgi:hypothetical protein
MFFLFIGQQGDEKINFSEQFAKIARRLRNACVTISFRMTVASQVFI